jgi:hypothetical protein
MEERGENKDEYTVGYKLIGAIFFLAILSVPNHALKDFRVS